MNKETKCLRSDAGVRAEGEMVRSCDETGRPTGAVIDGLPKGTIQGRRWEGLV